MTEIMTETKNNVFGKIMLTRSALHLTNNTEMLNITNNTEMLNISAS